MIHCDCLFRLPFPLLSYLQLSVITTPHFTYTDLLLWPLLFRSKCYTHRPTIFTNILTMKVSNCRLQEGSHKDDRYAPSGTNYQEMTRGMHQDLFIAIIYYALAHCVFQCIKNAWNCVCLSEEIRNWSAGNQLIVGGYTSLVEVDTCSTRLRWDGLMWSLYTETSLWVWPLCGNHW